MRAWSILRPWERGTLRRYRRNPTQAAVEDELRQSPQFIETDRAVCSSAVNHGVAICEQLGLLNYGRMQTESRVNKIGSVECHEPS